MGQEGQPGKEIPGANPTRGWGPELGPIPGRSDPRFQKLTSDMVKAVNK
jgi:hypothetical protein